jgi:hypothetical protein
VCNRLRFVITKLRKPRMKAALLGAPSLGVAGCGPSTGLCNCSWSAAAHASGPSFCCMLHLAKTGLRTAVSG